MRETRGRSAQQSRPDGGGSGPAAVIRVALMSAAPTDHARREVRTTSWAGQNVAPPDGRLGSGARRGRQDDHELAEGILRDAYLHLLREVRAGRSPSAVRRGDLTEAGYRRQKAEVERDLMILLDDDKLVIFDRRGLRGKAAEALAWYASPTPRLG